MVHRQPDYIQSTVNSYRQKFLDSDISHYILPRLTEKLDQLCLLKLYNKSIEYCCRMEWNERNFVTIKMAELKVPISQMLNYLSVPSKSIILRNLLDEAEYLIMQIPDTEQAMITDWREQLSEWWAVFAEKDLSKEENDDDLQSVSDFELRSNVAFFMVEYASSYENNDFEVKNPTMEDVLNFFEKIFVKTEPLKVLPKAEKLKELQDFFELVNRAEKYSFAYLSDSSFQSTFLRYILAKLSEELQTKFCDTPPEPHARDSFCQLTLDRPRKPSRQPVFRPKTVNKLKDFLIDEIQELDDELKKEKRIEELYSGSLPETGQLTNATSCSFCLAVGHTLLSCQKVIFLISRLKLVN